LNSGAATSLSLSLLSVRLSQPSSIIHHLPHFDHPTSLDPCVGIITAVVAPFFPLFTRFLRLRLAYFIFFSFYFLAL
jgi:hypothetical protein